jgi:hypothetical protein
MTTHIQDLLVVNLAVAAAVALCWGWGRTVRGGRPLTPPLRGMLLFGFLFALGMGYIMMFGSWFAWPTRIWFVLIAAWGVLLALIVWWRHLRKSEEPHDPSASKQ